MSTKTTLVLLALVAGLTAAFLLSRPGQEAFRPPGPGPGSTVRLFDDLRGKEVDAMTLKDPTRRIYKHTVHFRRRHGTWTVQCPDIQGGRLVRARENYPQGVLETLQALVSDRRLAAASPRTLVRNGLGQQPHMEVLVHSLSGKSLVLGLGATIEPVGLAVYRQGDQDIREVDQAVRDSLFPPLVGLWDNRLVPLDIMAARELSLQPAGKPGVKLEKLDYGWRLTAPLDHRADRERSESWRNGLMNLVIDHYPPGIGLGKERLKAIYTVHIKTRDPDDEISLRFGLPGKDGIPVVSSREEGPVLVSRDALALLEVGPEHFRDRRVNPIPDSRKLLGLVLKRGDLVVLELQRQKGRLRIRGGKRLASGRPGLLVDDVLWNAFFRKLDGLCVERFDSAAKVKEPSLELKVRLGDNAREARWRDLLFGAPTAGGEVPVSVVGQGEGGFIQQTNLDFLNLSWWELASRSAARGTAPFKIGRIALRKKGGTEVLFTSQALGNSVALYKGAHPYGQRVPKELADAVFMRLVYPTHDGWVGEQAKDRENGLLAPFLAVKWLKSPRGSQSQIPLQGTWEELDFGALSQGMRWGWSKAAPSLIFQVKSEDLGPYLRLLEWAAR